MTKRLFDIVVSAISIVLLLPMLIVIAVVIWVADRQNPLFLQERLGVGMSPFIIIKYRSMRQGTITPLGRFLRNTGIDELPQLLNVLFGTMSLVGPRPLTNADVVRLGWNNDRYRSRWSLRPGIVGLAQLSNVCDAKMSLLYDRLYARDRSLLMDVKILAASGLIVFVGKRHIQRWVHRRKR